VIDGGEGDDRLFGDGGTDLLDGGTGRNLLTGGEGADVFRFVLRFGETPGSHQTTITDFSGANGGDGDRIDIADYNFDPVAGEEVELTFLGHARFTGEQGEVRYLFTRSGNTKVELDLDGDKHADLRITLRGTHDLQADDLVLQHDAGLI